MALNILFVKEWYDIYYPINITQAGVEKPEGMRKEKAEGFAKDFSERYFIKNGVRLPEERFLWMMLDGDPNPLFLSSLVGAKRRVCDRYAVTLNPYLGEERMIVVDEIAEACCK